MKDKIDNLEKFDKREVREIPLAAIILNRFQPRKAFEKESLRELIDSIREHGVLRPIILRPDPQKPGIFEIIMGERR
ncbi:MAG: ParB/RepB/Spo0J family partition protein, partial [Planctomycetota bacterium]